MPLAWLLGDLEGSKQYVSIHVYIEDPNDKLVIHECDESKMLAVPSK